MNQQVLADREVPAEALGLEEPEVQVFVPPEEARAAVSAQSRASLQRSAALTQRWRMATKAIRTGRERTHEGEHSEAIFETSSYVYGCSRESEAVFSGSAVGNVYSRFTNPTVRSLELRLAALEGGQDCIGTASGMAALMVTFMTVLKAGDHVICSRSVFGSTITLLKNFFAKFGVQATYVDPVSADAWRTAVQKNTKLLFCESPSNPLLEVVDLEFLAATAPRGASLVVDNTLCTPYGQNPLALGADLVVHSTGKYIDGHGRCVGGAVVGRAELIDALRGFMRCAGPAMSAHNAWVFLKGLETLQLRMERHASTAQAVAEWLAIHPAVSAVQYPGLSTHPQHELARRQQRNHGGVVSFHMRGGRAAAWRCIDNVRMISRTTNIGDAKTTITHPASTTHVKLSAAERASMGVTDSLVRITTGLEDVDDILDDLHFAMCSP